MYVTEMAEWLDAMSSVKFGMFWSPFQASSVSSHTEELWYNETVCLRMTIYIYIYIYISFFKKKTKDWLIHDYKFISVPYFQFLVWTKKHEEKKLIQDFFRPNG